MSNKIGKSLVHLQYHTQNEYNVEMMAMDLYKRYAYNSD